MKNGVWKEGKEDERRQSIKRNKELEKLRKVLEEDYSKGAQKITIRKERRTRKSRFKEDVGREINEY